MAQANVMARQLLQLVALCIARGEAYAGSASSSAKLSDELWVYPLSQVCGFKGGKNKTVKRFAASDQLKRRDGFFHLTERILICNPFGSLIRSNLITTDLQF